MGRNEGKVELTWTNKSQRLVTVENPDGGLPYQWVPPTDYRVAEVRLLSEVAKVGEPTDAPNYLVVGDALHALAAVGHASAGSEDLTRKVKLAYLDPPFNTGKTFDNYEDNLEVSIYLTMMRDRLRQILPLLAADGSVWVHCDDSMGAHLRLLMDEVFLAKNFVATIVWQKRQSRENVKAIGSGHDYIHVYAMNGPVAWSKTRNKLAKNDEVLVNPDNDPRGPWRSIPFSGKGYRPNQQYKITTPTGVVHIPPKGRHWARLESGFEELRAADRVYFPKNGDGRPRIKEFGAIAGLVPMSWWPASEVGDNDEAKKEILDLFPDDEAFETPKPERLMRRIIEIATNEGDLVLDPFAGSATTAASAHKLGRRWVTCEMSRDSVDRYDLPRLTKVVAGEDQGGVTEDVGWEGGGGFTVLEVEPSMFVEEDGVIVLADWAAGGLLGESVTAQLGFRYEPLGPFCGRKGRTRLAVIDGLVNVAAIDLLLEQLDDKEGLLVCGTGLDPASATHLSGRRPGSLARLIPQAILAGYGRPRRWTPAVPKIEAAS